MLRASLLILSKDLRLRVRDRSVWLFAFVVPIGLTFLFSTIFPGTDDLHVAAAVVDQDGGEAARGFVDGVLPALADQDVVTLVEVADEADARRRVAEGSIDAAWILPAGFTDAIGQGQDTTIEVLAAAGPALPGELAQGVAAAYARRLEQVALALGLAEQAVPAALGPELMGAVAGAAADLEPLIEVGSATTGSGDRLTAVSYLAGGMAAFFVFFVVQYGVTGLLEEREVGTLPRLRAAPIASGAIQLGKLLGAFLLGLASLVVLALASHLLLGADWGPAPGIAVLVLALLIAALGVMFLVGQFARTAEQAGNYQSVVAIVLGLAGGVFVPLPTDAGIMQIVSRLSPHGWFLRGLEQQVASGQWSSVLPAAAAIAAFGVVLAVPAAALQRRRSL